MNRKTDKNNDTAKINRRSFLGMCAGVSGGAVMGMHSFDVMADVVPHSVETWKGSEEIASICGMCVNRCGIKCRVENGVLEKINGDPLNPKSKGGTCAKGQAGVMQVYDPDRIKYPMIRVGERGSGKWRRASWDEAFQYVGENLAKIIDKHGAKSLLWSSTTDLTEKFFVKFGEYIGTSNFVRHATLCLASRNVGYFATMGGVPDADLANSKYIIMFGANRLESFELPYNIDMIEGIKKGGKLVVVDPRMTYTAAKGEWIPIRPRTDLALTLSLMHVLIKEELYDKEFVANRTHGFKELKEHVRQYTPEWAAQETEIPAEKIISMAREMAEAAPAVAIFPGRRSSWYTNDTQFRRTTAMLAGLLGAFDAPGACHFSSGKQKLGSFEWEIGPFDVEKRVDDFHEHFPLSHGGDGGYISTRDAIIGDEGKYPVKGWMVYHQNPLVGVMDESKTRKMIEQMEFICAIDIQPSQTAWMADIILPETTYLERLDPLFSPAATRKYVAIRQPVVPPQHESKTILEIIQGIAADLDKRHEFETSLTEAFNFKMEDFVSAQLSTLSIDLETMKKKGIWLGPDDPLYFGAFRDGNKKFKTPTGKIEFTSERFRRNNYPVLPEHEPLKLEAGKQRLITGRHAWFTHSFNQNNKWLHDLYPENEVWLNPEVASTKGITNGEYVKVRSSRGEVTIKAKVTSRIRNDTVFICHGFGGDAGGHTTLKGKGGADQVLMESASDDISNNQAMHETFVEVLKV